MGVRPALFLHMRCDNVILRRIRTHAPPLHQDGYAVVAGDGPGEFDVLFEVGAGPIADALSVRPGTVAYINTGGALPPGADAVVQVENTVLLPPTASGGRRVRIVKVTSSSPFTATRPFLISL